MEIKLSSFEQTTEYQNGLFAQKLVAGLLMRRDWYVIPSYDYTGPTRDKAPRMYGRLRGYILPDLDVARGGRRAWVEVKFKTSLTITRIPKCRTWPDCPEEHGFELQHYRDYCKVREITGCEVWICIYEADTREIRMQNLAVLERVGNSRIYQGGNMGRNGMFFFPRPLVKLWAVNAINT